MHAFKFNVYFFLPCRIGSLEILSRHGEVPQLKQLLGFVLRQNFPLIWAEEEEEKGRQQGGNGPGAGALLEMFAKVTGQCCFDKGIPETPYWPSLLLLPCFSFAYSLV